MHVWPYASIPSYTIMLFVCLSIGVHFYSVVFDEACGQLYLYDLYITSHVFSPPPPPFFFFLYIPFLHNFL